jgi:5-methyltetrahydrofolate--homocysteine methyltransferase
MARDFLKELKDRALVFDGATGTMLQKFGMKPGGSPDELCLTNPEMVGRVHRAYAEAGSDVVTTNTFGANRAKLREYDLEDSLRDINVNAVKIARNAAPGLFVAGGLGPIGRFVEPIGDLNFDEAVEIFTEQARALKDGGADLFIIETMMDLKEMKAAIIGARSAGLPIAATMTFDATMRTVLGTPPEVFAIVAEGLGADVVGANCSLGIDGIYRAISAMSTVTSLPLIAQPNAGIPELRGKETVFPASPEEMAWKVRDLADAGVRVLGGCCGTTPDHIRAMAAELKKHHPVGRGEPRFTALASRTRVSLFGAGLMPILIGERINPTGRKAFADEIKESKTKTIREEARAQAEAGAHALDVNVGVPDIDEPSAMKRAVLTVNDHSTLPIVVDSPNIQALEAGLKAVDGRPLINSVSGEEKKLRSVLPLAKKYGAAVLGLALDDSGIPATAEGRFKVAERMLAEVLKAGLRREDLVIDCLAMTVSADPKGALTTLETIRLVKERLGLSTALGVSNISFGLPKRGIVNANFLSMAFAAGLDAAIVNPKLEAVLDSYYSSCVLLGRDPRAEQYIKRYAEAPKVGGHAEAAPALKKKESILDKLALAVVQGDEEHVVTLVEEGLGAGGDAMSLSNDGLLKGLEEVGRLFASNRYYLPQVILSADTMKKGFDRLRKEFKAGVNKSRGKVIMATVEGDIHDIGKNIVCTLLENHGFEVFDLGKNVPADRIVETAREKKADVVGLSALMTTTVMEMDTVIKKLRDAGLNVKVAVGGAVVTEEFAGRIGADAYGGDALNAVEVMKRLVPERG